MRLVRPGIMSQTWVKGNGSGRAGLDNGCEIGGDNAREAAAKAEAEMVVGGGDGGVNLLPNACDFSK